ncbi:MAG: chlorophyll synthesis pathway protein BchC [Pseudomonadota bacterium]
MRTSAVVVDAPRKIAVRDVVLSAPAAGDAVVDVRFSGISTGTERLIWSGDMPMFPGFGYPLVPGYESVGEVAEAAPDSGLAVGEFVFVPGSKGFEDVRGLFGGSARRIVSQSSRLTRIDPALAKDGTLFALAATAYHILATGTPPDLIVGHGALGRLLARLTVVFGHPSPRVWEQNPARHDGADGYEVIAPEDDQRKSYVSICDVSGDPKVLNTLIGYLAPGGEITLAGFYPGDVRFSFPPAFMKEARLRVAAEWKPDDLRGVRSLVESGALSLGNLVTHAEAAGAAAQAYETAFTAPDCLKMVLDWSDAT